MSKNQKIHSISAIKIIASILCVIVGVLSLIFLAGDGFSYTIYVPVLICSIAIASFLISSCLVSGILHHKKVEQKKIDAMTKWINIFSSGIALLVLAPLIIILFSAKGVSIWIIFLCFLIAVSLSVILVVIGIVKIINICREPLDEKYTLFEGENCPCWKKSCKYHGNCTACVAHHHNKSRKTKTSCERLKEKIDIKGDK
ncbi:hypothetical protein [Intestinibacter sp.]|uniref:hypothetical protein n=1 Tax=Intestinibacter sp. TaxID=1965304 RepID=UPI003F187C9D